MSTSLSGLDQLMTNEHRAAPARVICVAMAVNAIGGGAVTLAGWFLRVPRMADWDGDGIAMFPNAALCALLSGVALFVIVVKPRAVLPARLLAGAVLLISGLTLSEHTT